jgi:general stress protein YciG
MADPSNPGQFGNRPDTIEQARRGGHMSGGNFANDPERASKAGKIGAAHQSRAAKALGGRNSHRS